MSETLHLLAKEVATAVDCNCSNCFCFFLHFQKRPCLEDSSWLTENTCNMETENRLILCSSSQPVTKPPYPPHPYVCNQPLTNPSSMALNVHVDVNCNTVNEGNNTQEMEVSCETANSAQSHVQLHHVSYDQIFILSFKFVMVIGL